MKSFFSKKANLSLRKIIVFTLIIMVIFFIFPQTLNLIEFTKTGISSFEESQCEMNSPFTIYNCEIRSCNEGQQEKWDSMLKYLNNKECLGNLQYKTNSNADISTDKACTCIQQKIWDVKTQNVQDQNYVLPSQALSDVQKEIFNDINDIKIILDKSWQLRDFKFSFNGKWDHSSNVEKSKDFGYIVNSLKDKDLADGLSVFKELINNPKGKLNEIEFQIPKNNIEITYTFKNNVLTQITYLSNNNPPFVIETNKNEEPKLISKEHIPIDIYGGGYNEDEFNKIYNILDSYNCREFVLKNKKDESIKYKNYDISCSESFSFTDIMSVDFRLDMNNIDKLPSEIKLTIENLQKNQLDNGKNAYEYLIEFSKQNNLNPILPLTVLIRESRGNPNAISPTGAVGLAQFTSSTARDFQHIFIKITPCCTIAEAKSGICGQSNVRQCFPSNDDRFDAKKSIEAGVLYLKRHYNNYDGNVLLILTAYNAGSEVANKCKNLNEKEIHICILRETQNSHGDNKVKEVERYLAEITKNINEITTLLS